MKEGRNFFSSFSNSSLYYRQQDQPHLSKKVSSTLATHLHASLILLVYKVHEQAQIVLLGTLLYPLATLDAPERGVVHATVHTYELAMRIANSRHHFVANLKSRRLFLRFSFHFLSWFTEKTEAPELSPPHGSFARSP